MLQWTRDWGEAQKLAYEVALAFSQEFQAVREPGAGVREWLQALASSNVPCALVTTMDRCLSEAAGWNATAWACRWFTEEALQPVIVPTRHLCLVLHSLQLHLLQASRVVLAAPLSRAAEGYVV